MNSQFLNIWLQHDSWTPIVLTYEKGWQTIKNRKGGPIPLRANHLDKAYDQYGEIIGKRFGRLTNYLMVDIDRGSQYHPLNGSLEPIVDALEDVGLVEGIKIRSSASLGLHLYFPLDQPVKSWRLAKEVSRALKNSGVEIKNGTCEVFPNVKPYEPDPGKRTEYQGHRLPLQAGSFILDDEFNPTSAEQSDFVLLWEAAASRNLIHRPDAERPKLKEKQLPPLPEFTGPCQTNSVLPKLANYGSRHLGLTTVPELSSWMQKTVIALPGYGQWCSEASQKDIERGWCTRWAKSHLKSQRIYKAKHQGPNHNQAIAQDAMERLEACVAKLTGQTFSSLRQVWMKLREIGKQIFGFGIAWPTFKKLSQLWQHLLENTASGTGLLEAPPPTRNTAPKPAHTVINGEGVYTKAGQGFEGVNHPPVVAVSEAPKGVADNSGIKQQTDQDLKEGDQVKIWLPGCPQDGIETIVKSKQRDACDCRVYRLGVRLAGRFMELPIECLRAINPA